MSAELELLEEELAEEEQSRATFEHEYLALKIASALQNFLDGKDLGLAFGSSVEYTFLEQLEDNEPRRKGSKQPDVSFLPKAKLPARLRSYGETVPDLVVEISSPTDREYFIGAKVAFYQKQGVKLVWVVQPYTRTVLVYRLASGLTPEPFGIDRTLSGEEVIPGFSLAVSKLFDYPFDPDPLPDPKPKAKKSTPN